MGAVVAASRALGGVRVLVVAAVLGTTALGDTFQSSNSVSNVLFELLAAGALSAVLVPTFVGLGDDDVEEVSGRVLGLAVAGLSVVAVVGIVLAPQIADLLTASVDDPATAEAQQELSTTLLRFFMPQVVLYGVGAVADRPPQLAATATPRLRRHRSATPSWSSPPWSSSASWRDPDPGPRPHDDRAGGARAGRARSASPPSSASRSSRRGSPGSASVRGCAAPGTTTGCRRLLGLSGWGALQHVGAGLLLGAAIVVGGGVTGGVIAYQVAYVVFLTPYGILAQPILTTVLPLMSRQRGRRRQHVARGSAAVGGRRDGDGHAAGIGRVRGAVDPDHDACSPSAGRPRATASSCWRRRLASLAVGIFPYGAFLLFARAWYALGDSRTPALAALVSPLVGVAGDGRSSARRSTARRGSSCSAARTPSRSCSARLWLAIRLRAVVGGPGAARSATWPGRSRSRSESGLVAWVLMEAWEPDGRLVTLVAIAVVVRRRPRRLRPRLRATGGFPARSPVGVHVRRLLLTAVLAVVAA